jgi:hypothetical protein
MLVPLRLFREIKYLKLEDDINSSVEIPGKGANNFLVAHKCEHR